MHSNQHFRRYLIRLLVLIFSSPWAAAHVGHSHHSHDDDHLCGTEVPPLQEEIEQQLRLDALRTITGGSHERRRKLQLESCDELCIQCIEIETYLHLIGVDMGFGPIIPHPPSAVEMAKENITSVTNKDFSTEDDIVAMFEENIEVMNKAFASTPFRFTFIKEATTRTNNHKWSRASVDHKEAIGRALGSRDLRKLDCFVSATLKSAQNGEILGTATLPGSQSVGKGDGVYLRYDTLSGGGRKKNDMGYTLVHEAAHWLGLLHTFQILATTDPCDPAEEGFGDFVDDTPMQNGPTSKLVSDCTRYLGGVLPPNSCPNLPGRDAIFVSCLMFRKDCRGVSRLIPFPFIQNYLNYPGHEECLDKEGTFTCGQIERMHRQWLLFRDQISSCSDPVHDMEVELLFTFDTFYRTQNSFKLINEEGGVLFDRYVALYVFTIGYIHHR